MGVIDHRDDRTSSEVAATVAERFVGVLIDKLRDAGMTVVTRVEAERLARYDAELTGEYEDGTLTEAIEGVRDKFQDTNLIEAVEALITQRDDARRALREERLAVKTTTEELAKSLEQLGERIAQIDLLSRWAVDVEREPEDQS